MDTIVDWTELSDRFTTYVRAQPRNWIAPDESHYAATLEFDIGRLAEGRGVGAYLLDRLAGRPLRCLDLGGGSGGVAVGLSNFRQIEVHASEIEMRDMHRVRRATGLPFGIVVSPGDALPFPDETFDAVVFLETLEHVRDAKRLCREIMRVLKPGGLCMITTPARMKYALRPDPHYGIRGLLLLPDRLQEPVARYLANVRLYDVQHTYWTLRGLVREFPGASVREIFWNHPRPYRSRLLNAVWTIFRNNLWDRIVLQKIA